MAATSGTGLQPVNQIFFNLTRTPRKDKRDQDFPNAPGKYLKGEMFIDQGRHEKEAQARCRRPPTRDLPRGGNPDIINQLINHGPSGAKV
jgi:hypothetical protein